MLLYPIHLSQSQCILHARILNVCILHSCISHACILQARIIHACIRHAYILEASILHVWILEACIQHAWILHSCILHVRILHDCIPAAGKLWRLPLSQTGELWGWTCAATAHWGAIHPHNWGQLDAGASRGDYWGPPPQRTPRWHSPIGDTSCMVIEGRRAGHIHIYWCTDIGILIYIYSYIVI